MASSLPVTYSLVAAPALQQHIILHYENLAEASVLFLAQGFHDTYLVTGQQVKYVFRVYRANWKTREQVMAELFFLLQLHKHGLSVSFPIPDHDHHFIQTLSCPEGERYGVLFRYAHGEKVLTLTSPQALLFGKHLAQLHGISETLKTEGFLRIYTVEAIVDGTLQALEITLPDEASSLNTAKKVGAQLKKKLDAASLQSLRKGICHGDPHFENIFIDHTTETVTSFDYDFCGWGYLLYDLGSFCRYERSNPAAIQAFMQGYEQVRPLSLLEKELIPYFEVLMRFFHLGARASHADGIKNPKWFPQDIAITITEIEEQLENYLFAN